MGDRQAVRHSRRFFLTYQVGRKNLWISLTKDYRAGAGKTYRFLDEIDSFTAESGRTTHGNIHIGRAGKVNERLQMSPGCLGRLPCKAKIINPGKDKIYCGNVFSNEMQVMIYSRATRYI